MLKDSYRIKMLNMRSLPADDNVLQMFKEDRAASEQAGETHEEFIYRESKKLFQAYVATGCDKYHRAYQILTEMKQRQRS